jgi:hypothetical protein
MVFAFRRLFLALKNKLNLKRLIIIALDFFLYFCNACKQLYRIEPTGRVRKKENMMENKQTSFRPTL